MQRSCCRHVMEHIIEKLSSISQFFSLELSITRGHQSENRTEAQETEILSRYLLRPMVISCHELISDFYPCLNRLLLSKKSLHIFLVSVL